MSLFYTLKVAALDKPIKDATTITFDVPEHLYETFAFYPGQHLILKFRINGEEARRSYSLNSCPYTNDPLQVTVKKVYKGLVSNYVNDQLKVGDELEVMAPQGRFCAKMKEGNYKSYFLFAAGSGITPIMAILQSVLHAEPYSSVCLFYGNKNKSSIIFHDDLEQLKKEFPDHLQVVHTLSEPYSDWSAVWGWDGRKGRIDKAAVEWFIEQHPPQSQRTEYYICGPGKMNTGIRQALMNMGIPKELIHIEQFGGSTEEINEDIVAADQAQLKATVNGQAYEVAIPQGQTILQALKAAKANPPYSCESGVCGTCVAKVTKGTAKMKMCMALEDADVEKGLVLTCQALPTSEQLAVVFE